MGTGELSGKHDEMLGVTLQWSGIPSRGEVAILLFAPCEGNWYMLRVGGPVRKMLKWRPPIHSAIEKKRLLRSFTS